MKHYVCHKKGSALVIAIFFAFCMMILLGAMVFRQTSTSSHNQVSLLDKQAYFAARSAMQHFLLKAKLFPTELYDAVEISQGKNPLFNFTEFPEVNDEGREAFEEYIGRPNVYVKKDNSELDGNHRPRYYYVKLPNKNSFIRLASYHNPDYRFLISNIAQDIQDKKYTDPKELHSSYKPLKYINYYYRDCINYEDNNKVLQPLLETIKSNTIKNINSFDIATEEGYPYTLRYSVVDVKVKAIQGMKKYGEEAIEITVEGNAINHQNKSKTQLISRVQKITRKGSI